MEQEPKKFYEFMGNNPLKYENLPVMNVEPGWYFYDDIFKLSGDAVTELAHQKITNAYQRLKNFLESKK